MILIVMLSQIGLSIPQQLKIYQRIKNEVWRSLVQILRECQLY